MTGLPRPASVTTPVGRSGTDVLREACQLPSRPDLERHPRRVLEEPRDPLREEDGPADLRHPVRAVLRPARA